MSVRRPAQGEDADLASVPPGSEFVRRANADKVRGTLYKTLPSCREEVNQGLEKTTPLPSAALSVFCQ